MSNLKQFISRYGMHETLDSSETYKSVIETGQDMPHPFLTDSKIWEKQPFLYVDSNALSQPAIRFGQYIPFFTADYHYPYALPDNNDTREILWMHGGEVQSGSLAFNYRFFDSANGYHDHTGSSTGSIVSTHSHAVTSVNNTSQYPWDAFKLYKYGGIDINGNVISDLVEAYRTAPYLGEQSANISYNTLSTAGPKRYYALMYCNVNTNKIYIIGGYDENNNATDTVWEYDIANDSWTQKTSAPYNITIGSAHEFINSNNERCVLIIGNVDDGSTRYTYTYNTDTDQWDNHYQSNDAFGLISHLGYYPGCMRYLPEYGSYIVMWAMSEGIYAAKFWPNTGVVNSALNGYPSIYTPPIVDEALKPEYYYVSNGPHITNFLHGGCNIIRRRGRYYGVFVGGDVDPNNTTNRSVVYFNLQDTILDPVNYVSGQVFLSTKGE